MKRENHFPRRLTLTRGKIAVLCGVSLFAVNQLVREKKLRSIREGEKIMVEARDVYKYLYASRYPEVKKDPRLGKFPRFAYSLDEFGVRNGLSRKDVFKLIQRRDLLGTKFRSQWVIAVLDASNYRRSKK